MSPMPIVYLAAFVLGLGALVTQIALGGKGDAPHGGPDLAADGHGADHAGDHPDEAGPSTFLLSLRFWVFLLLAFGITGSLLALLHLAGPIGTAAVATLSGVASGVTAVMVFRAADQTKAVRPAEAREAVGQVGRVLVACAKGRTGQVRVALRGQSVDLIATTADDEIRRGEDVLIEDVRSGVAHVSRPPREIVQ
jgi:membrane protein implicated in regulation of membrane protease activity